MTDKLGTLTPLLKSLAPLLKKHGLKREPDEGGMAIFARKRAQDIQRVGFGIEKSCNKKGEFEFAVLVGVEFGDLPNSPRRWAGLPRTHERTGLDYMFTGATRNQIRKKCVCSVDTDWKALAPGFSEWIATGLDELASRRDKLRASYVTRVESAGKTISKRLSFLAEQRQKELRQRNSKEQAFSGAGVTDALNVFELATALLRAKADKIEELMCNEFTDADAAHDRTIRAENQEDILNKARLIQVELESGISLPEETGQTEHAAIPVNGVLYYALWQIGWKYLYVVASQEDTELPMYLLIGTTSFPH